MASHREAEVYAHDALLTDHQNRGPAAQSTSSGPPFRRAGLQVYHLGEAYDVARGCLLLAKLDGAAVGCVGVRHIDREARRRLRSPGFSAYDQDHWVDVQAYSESPWTDLIQLWRLYNLHLSQVIAQIDGEELQ